MDTDDHGMLDNRLGSIETSIDQGSEKIADALLSLRDAVRELTACVQKGLEELDKSMQMLER